jgi:sugar-specific transcriptional regulator TrmB
MNKKVYKMFIYYNNMINETLEGIGLTKSEIKVYLALLDLGSSSTGPLIKKSGVASSKIYELLDKLIEKGLVSFHIESETKHFTAADPHRLISYTKNKKNDLEKKHEQLKEIMPLLESRYKNFDKETKVELFQGYKGVETIFNDMIHELKKNDEFLVIGGGNNTSQNERTKQFFEKIHKKRSDKGIKLKIIFSESRRKSMKEIKLFPFTEYRYIPENTPSTINIYKDIIILLTMSPTPAAIRIKDKNITESYRIYFNNLWEKFAKK